MDRSVASLYTRLKSSSEGSSLESVAILLVSSCLQGSGGPFDLFYSMLGGLYCLSIPMLESIAPARIRISTLELVQRVVKNSNLRSIISPKCRNPGLEGYGRSSSANRTLSDSEMMSRLRIVLRPIFLTQSVGQTD